MKTTTVRLVATVLCAMLCGCGRRAEDVPTGTAFAPASADATSAPEGVPAKPPVRTEFVILRELVKQHAKQTEAGNEELLESVRRHLRERVAAVPDQGRNDDERNILKEAKVLAEQKK